MAIKITCHEALGRLRKNKVEWTFVEQKRIQDTISGDFMDGIESLQESQRIEIIKKGMTYLKGNKYTILSFISRNKA